MMRRLWLAAVAALALGAVPQVSAQATHESILEGQLRARLRTIADTTHGVLGVSLVDLKTGRAVGLSDSLVFPQGSAIKIPILVELYKQVSAGRLSADERVPIRKSDQVAGSGIAQWFGDGHSTVSLHDLAVLMIVLSDNTATNMLIDRVGGFAAVNSTMDSLGVGAIRLQRKMIQPLASARGEENIATPAAAAALMRRIAQCELPMSREHCAAVRRILELPKGGAIPSSVPAGVRVAWKPGGIEGVQTAWGIVDLPGRPYIVVAMMNYADGDAASAALREVSDAAYQYYRRLARASAYGVRVPLSVADSIRTP